MARDGSKLKGGAYPLDEKWRRILFRLFEPFKANKNRHSYILDPFANTGDTLLVGAKMLNMEPFAVELQDEFIPKLRENIESHYNELGDSSVGLVRAVHDNSFNVDMSHGAFGIVLLNPPYDTMLISDPERHSTNDAFSRKERVELTALRKMFDRVAINGYMVWIAYAQHMTGPVFNEFRRNCDKISVFRFPELHLDHYTQVVVIGQYLKGHKKSRLAADEDEQRRLFIEKGKDPSQIMPLDEVCRILDEKKRYLFPSIPPYRAGNGVVLFRPSMVDPATTLKLGQRYGAQTTAWFREMTAAPEEPKPIVPVHNYNKSRIAVNLAAGMLDGAMINWKGRPSRMRGRVEDVAKQIGDDQEVVSLKEGTVMRTTRTTLIHPGYRVTIINDEGTIEDVSDPDLLMQIITDNAEYLLSELKTRYKPFFDMEIHPVWKKMYKMLKVGGTSSYFRAQRYIVACQTEFMAVHKKHMAAVAPGGGKTSMTGGVMIGLRILHAATVYKDTGKLNEIAKHFELTGPELLSLLDRFEQRYGRKPNELHVIRPGEVVIVACPPIAPRIWLEQELPPMYPHFEMSALKHTTDLEDFFKAAAEDTDPRILHVGVVTYMDAKLNEGIEPAAATRIVRQRVRNMDERGATTVSIQADRSAIDPITGNEIIHEGKKVAWERFTKEKRGKELLVYGGKEYHGRKMDIVVKADGSREVVRTGTKRETQIMRVRLPQFLRDQNEAEGWPRFAHRFYPLYSQVRRIGLPKVGNGVAITPMREVVIPPRTFETVTYKNGRAERITVTTRGGMFQAPDFKKQTPVNKKEKILDRWIAYKGIRVTRDGKKSRPRVPIASELRRVYAGRIAMFVADEVHLAKSNTTDTGSAFKDMLMASNSVIGLTGTLYGGKSSSLYAIAFHFADKVRDEYGWQRGFPMKWVEDMGVRKVIEKFDSPMVGNSVRSGAKRVGQPQVKEAAGASPLLMQTCDEFTSWMSLDDIGDKMPEKFEEAICINFDPQQKAVFSRAYDTISQYNNDLIARGDRTFMASYYTNLLYLPDSMFRDNPVIHRIAMDKGAARRKHADVHEKVVFTVPSLGDDIRPKEDAVLKALEKDIADGRRVIISVMQTGTRDIRQRYLGLIATHVKTAKALVLESSITPADRSSYLAKMVKQGYNVLITNPGLITTAVSFNDWSVWYSVEFSSSLAVHSQATARINRPSQKSPSIIYRHFYYNDGKFQVLSIQNIADKSKAAAVLYGTNAESLSSMMGSDERVADYSALIKAIDAGKAKLKSQDEINRALNTKTGGFSDWRESAWYMPGDEQDAQGEVAYVYHEDTDILQNGSEEEEEEDDGLIAE